MRYWFMGLAAVSVFGGVLACCFAGPGRTGNVVPPTFTPRPTFTATLSPAVTDSPVPTETATFTPPAGTPTPPVPTFAATPPPPTETPLPPRPSATHTPTSAPTPSPAPTPDATASWLKYVLADAGRELNCSEVAVYGTVLDANNRPLPGVTVEVVGIHGTAGRFVGVVGDDGRYRVQMARFADLPYSEWYVAVFENDEEVSERFHWTATSACQSNDSGDSQVLRVDWKLME